MAFQNEVVRPDANAELKLLADLAAANAAYADHFDPAQFDRDLAAAFRRYGLDLDAVDPKLAGEELGARQSTAEVAAWIDEWCRIRRTKLKTPNWRRLTNVARAADSDAWRDTLRDQYDRAPDETLPMLRALAAEGQSLEKQRSQTLILLNQMLAGAGDGPAAAMVLRVAARRFPGDFWVFYSQGYRLAEGAPDPDPAGAVRCFARAVALRPGSFAAHIGLGVALDDGGNLDLAVASFRTAIRLKPRSAEAYYNLGRALAQQGDSEQAISALREAIRLKPGDEASHLLLGYTLHGQKKPKEAIAAFREAMRIKPDLLEARLGLIIVLTEQRELDKAIAECREAIGIKRQFAEIHCQLGYALALQGKTDEAVAALRGAIEHDPKLAEAHATLGTVLRDKGKLSDAAAELRLAIRIDPDSLSGRSDLALRIAL